MFWLVTVQSQYVVQITSGIAQPLVKCAIVAFYLRLFGNVRWVRLFCYGWHVAIPCAYVAYVIVLLVFCVSWSSASLERCNQTAPATLVIGVFNVIIDIAIFVLPFFIISNLQINRQRKAALAGVFLVGFL